MNRMKVLITGASGFIGRHVLRQLTEGGIDTVVVGRSRPFGYSGKFIEADLLQSSSSEIVDQASATHIIHLAWYAEHGKYWTSPLNFRWLEATVRLIESFCAAGGRKVIVAGTCAEYDWKYGYCIEDVTPLNPTTLYGTVKDAARRLIEAVCRNYCADLAWARIFLPYGPGEDSRRLIPSLIDVFRGKRPPFGVNANAYRDFIHVEDVARGFIHLLTSAARGNYNIATGQPTPVALIVRQIARAYDGDESIVLNLATERPGEPEILFGDAQKLKGLGWIPIHSVCEICHVPDD